MISPRHPLRLPPYRANGTATTVNTGTTVALTEGYSWAGRPVGLAAAEPTLPVLWTPDTLAAFAGFTVDGYDADNPDFNVGLSVRRPGRGPVRVPRMTVYNSVYACQAARALADDLTARHASAMKHPALGLVQYFGANALAMACAPDGDFLSSDPEAASAGYFLPTGDETRWLGGDVFVLCVAFLQHSFGAFSVYDLDLSLIALFPEAASVSRDLWQRFGGRCNSLTAKVIYATILESVTAPEDVARQTAARDYHLAAYDDALAGLGGITTQDLGFLDTLDASPENVEEFLATPVREACKTALREHYGF